MKLVTVLLLIALPALCFADAGSTMVSQVVALTMTRSMDPTDYAAALGPELVKTSEQERSIILMKGIFNRFPECLPKFHEFMKLIYSSSQCSAF